jgi:hypothetical protein
MSQENSEIVVKQFAGVNARFKTVPNTPASPEPFDARAPTGVDTMGICGPECRY